MSDSDRENFNEEAKTVITAQPALAGRFQVVGILGQGSAGTVFEVVDLQRGGEHVALKVLRSTTVFDENTFQRFLEELKVSQRVRHPNLIEAYDFLELKDTVAFSMELIRGQSLGTILSKGMLEPYLGEGSRGPKFYARIDEIFAQVLSALEALHNRGIVHRDVKLDNILLDRGGQVKLGDLGLIKHTGSVALTQPGLLLGTAQYMPPEYIQRSQYDHRGDLYALGIALHEILIGHRRYSHRPGQQIIEELLRSDFYVEPVPLPLCPPKYQQIITKAVKNRPDQRFQSAREMREAFTHSSVSGWSANDRQGEANRNGARDTQAVAMEVGHLQRAIARSTKPSVLQRIERYELPFLIVIGTLLVLAIGVWALHASFR